MKRIHLLRFDGPPAALAPLFEAVRAEGLRAGWLELDPEPADAGDGSPPGESSGPLAEGRSEGRFAPGAAVSAGAFREAAVAPGRVVAIKRVVGPPVLRDLLREHFLGCALVMVRGGGPASAFEAELVEVPALETAAGSLRIAAPGQGTLELSPQGLAARLRRPRPWS
ncbi:MAG TPA: hypothetical protein VMR44_02040 [Thermoanaerobaculia bacterium]|nr:hypothetical protein [Thermoanaerobaculia bacterium]